MISSSPFSRTLALQKRLQSFATNMEAHTRPTDGLLSARIVGEFSAGKTRLISELFKDQLPESLMPISSLERQTRLPLEITYGESVALTLVKREKDFSTCELVSELVRFPERHEVHQLDAMQHRLRLCVNDPRLVLPEGDGYAEERTPKRLFLIDTPGWNSGDDELAEVGAEHQMTGPHNLALIYVCQASRLDGATNLRHLEDFLEALTNADFLDKPKVLMIITTCPPHEADLMKARAHEMVARFWTGLGMPSDELELDILPVDFKHFTAADLKKFRDTFWKLLLAPLNANATKSPAHPWATAIENWPEHWDITPQLQESVALVERAKRLIRKARQGDEYIAGMNIYRLLGLNPTALREKVLQTWLRQLGCTLQELQQWVLPSLPEDHPLLPWWTDYWLNALKNTLVPTQSFFEAALSAVGKLQADTSDIQKHFDQYLTRHHEEAARSLNDSFACLLRHTLPLCNKSRTTCLASLLSLSLLQSRYEDYLHQHKADLGLIIRAATA